METCVRYDLMGAKTTHVTVGEKADGLIGDTDGPVFGCLHHQTPPEWTSHGQRNDWI